MRDYTPGEPDQQVEFVATNLLFCAIHWALPATEWGARWCVSPDGNSRDCYFVQLYYRAVEKCD